MRNLVNIIDEMLRHVPETEEHLVADLTDLRSSTAYSAPELMGLRWRCGAEVLEEHFPADPKDFNDWQKKVCEVWMGRPLTENSVDTKAASEDNAE